MANGSDIYTGPRNLPYLSAAEAAKHQDANGKTVELPPGTKSVPVQPNDNLSKIAAEHGMTLQQLLALNPQYQSRNPDMIYPGEHVYVVDPKSAATDQAARKLNEAESRTASTDSQVTGKENAVADAKADLDKAVRAEIADGGDPEAIKQRLKNDPALDKVSDAEIDQIVDGASKPPSATNPAGGSREGAPLSAAADSNKAAKAYDQARNLGASTDSQATHRQEEMQKAGDDFKAAVKKELEQGTSAKEIKDRYGNDPGLNKLVDAAAQERTSVAAANKLDAAQSRTVSTDSQATNKDNAVAAAKTELEQSVRAEIADGGDPAKIKQRLKDDPAVKLDDAAIDQVVDAAAKPASRTNPVGGDAAKSAPFSPANATNQAAANVSPNETGKAAADHQAAFITAARNELKQGETVADLKARYGNDPQLNSLIDEAAKPG